MAAVIHPGGRGEPVHLFLALQLQDGAGADEADAGQQPLDHAAEALLLHAHLHRHQHDQAELAATSMWVRMPASLPWRSRCKPSMPSSREASTSAPPAA